jgi:5-dehydro-2-deoxygluconokinase
MTNDNKALDVITIGRCCVDFYGDQIGSRLEDMTSFSKYIGGCPTNIAAGTARLGLNVALISRVGDEHMGRFIREQLMREGVDVSHVKIDPERHTAYAMLGIEDKHTFPLILVRENCADAAMTTADIDEDFIASARAIVVTGTHFSRPNLAEASLLAIRHARANGTRVIFDVDFRPAVWGVAKHAENDKFVVTKHVADVLRPVLSQCDVVVGTEEELRVAVGRMDILDALREIRRESKALIVCKRGAMGCVLVPGAVPADLDDGIKGPAFPVEVYNTVGAGDAFMSGFLRGYMRDLPLEDCARLGNACGAIVVSRHGCAPASPTWNELCHFLAHGSAHFRLREDKALEQIHWSTTRWGRWPEVCALAMDHRIQLETMAAQAGAGVERIAPLKRLLFEAGRRVASVNDHCGFLIDDRFGADLLDMATKMKCWIGRPIELPKAIPLTFEGGRDVGVTLRSWPRTHAVKCLCYYHPDDPESLRTAQEARLLQLFEATRATAHELVIEVIASQTGRPTTIETAPAVMQRIYDIGIVPDWWKLESPENDAGWRRIGEVIEQNDRYCRGVLLLGLDAPQEVVAESIRRAAKARACKGFAVGRTLFSAAARDWFAGTISDAEVVDRVAAGYAALLRCWQEARRS